MAEASGIECCWVESSSLRAKKLYERWGFETIEEVVFKEDQRWPDKEALQYWVQKRHSGLLVDDKPGDWESVI